VQSRFREKDNQEVFLGLLSALLHVLVMHVLAKTVKKTRKWNTIKQKLEGSSPMKLVRGIKGLALQKGLKEERVFDRAY
jgi:hypothetical protein